MMPKPPATPNADVTSWRRIAHHLETVVMPAVGSIASDLHQRVPSEDLWQFKALIDTGEDIIAVTITAIGALEALSKTPPKVQEALPEGGHDAEDGLRIWAADPCGYQRPRWTIVVMGAIAWCSVLEGFLRGVATTAIDRTAVARVRTAFPNTNIEWSALERARDTITKRMLPSPKNDGQSFRYVEAAFACKVDPVIHEALLSLASFRNTVTHPKHGRRHDEHRDVPSSDEWVAWSAAVRTYAGTLVRALADRLDERRAAGETIPLFKAP
jgi:hypothetical protein